MAEKLFNQPQDRMITAYDLYGTNHQRNIKHFRFRASAYGLLIEHGKILLKRHPSIAEFDLPGGGIEMHETICEGLIREFKEETGLNVKLDKLVLVQDCFFTNLIEDAHGIMIFYTVKKDGEGKLWKNFCKPCNRNFCL
jgi:8-oxo-dGTP pyrophosphatase MutT (NUDIX family)